MPQYNHVGRAYTQVRYTDPDGRQLHPQGRRGATFTYQEVHVIYHNRHVACFNENEICLRTHGYRTVTTKVRMNQTSNQFRLGYTVYQRRGVWFVRWQGRELMFPANGSIILNRRQVPVTSPPPNVIDEYGEHARPGAVRWVTGSGGDVGHTYVDNVAAR